jgi:hypothetical protein
VTLDIYGEQREAAKHFNFIVYCINTRDERHLDEAGKYLDLLAADNRDMHDLVMKMLELVYGINWQAIRDSG